MTDLYDSLDQRLRPEAVAKLLRATPGWSAKELEILHHAARYADRWHGWTSMGEDFVRPDDAGSQVDAVRLLSGMSGPEPSVDVTDAQSVWDFALMAGEAIDWDPLRTDFKEDRLNREGRAAAGIDIRKRQYNRRFRALGRLAAKSRRLGRETLKRRLILIGRSGFATEIPRARFEADPNAAAFIAYYTARRNVRRTFTLSGRDNPYDEIAAMLFQRLPETSDWGIVALAYPNPSVLAQLSQSQLGELLGRWSAVMGQAARLLGEAWGDGTNVDRAKMIVRRGFDSSTWNTIAQAYNAARAGWLNVLTASGATGLLDDYCPAKAMRVMAGDLAYWHSAAGGDVHPDTRVASALPLPWLVVEGRERCSRQEVKSACQKSGVDPVAAGWTAPRATGGVAAFKPTLELVHGIAVADPAWATLLRRAGAFSGQGFNPEMLPAEIPEGVVVGPLADFRFPPKGEALE